MGRRKDHSGAYLSAMCRPLRPVWLALAVITACPMHAQEIKVERDQGSEKGAGRVGLQGLRENETRVPGLGAEVPGLDLEDVGTPWHAFGDVPGAAARHFTDSLWAELADSQDSVQPGQNVHWLRYPLRPRKNLQGVPLVLRVAAEAPFTVYLNGTELFRSVGMHRVAATARLPERDTLLPAEIPFTFLVDGATEAIAMRVEAPAGISLDALGYRATLHLADAAYENHRDLMHYGLFVGINLVIVLLALVLWVPDRREKSWLLLALLSFVSAVDTVAEVGADKGALGFTGMAYGLLQVLDSIITPWLWYLQIMVLGTMLGSINKKQAWHYTSAVLMLTLIGGSVGLAKVTDHTMKDLFNGSPLRLLALVVGGLLFVSVAAWFLIVVLRLALRLLRTKGHARWIGAGTLASMLLSIVLESVGSLFGTGLSTWLDLVAKYCAYVAVPMSIAVYLAVRAAHQNRLVARQRDELDQEVKDRTAELRSEKERSEELLLNILPGEVAEELKRTGTAAAKQFDLVTVMFTDFKGFTTLTEKVSPAELVEELNTCFKAFDAIIGTRDIEKIKTIGDAYMCAAGLPDPASSSPADVVHAALEMQAFMARRKETLQRSGRTGFDMRVGIHTGPVVAGIVGVKKFQYDIWGDTVNTASRMESSGEVGKVNISEATYGLVKEARKAKEGMELVDDRNAQHATEPAFTFTPRGKVQAKGKGEMEMYFVEPA
jgi:class 3 adenylate cyclase